MVHTSVIARNVEIRGCERKTSKAGNEYLIVRCDDEQGRRSDFMDKDLSREPYYKRGTFGDLTLNLYVGAKFSNVEILDFRISNENQG